MWICSSLSGEKKKNQWPLEPSCTMPTYWPSRFLVHSWTLGRVLASSGAFLNFQVHSFPRLWSSACSYWWVRRRPSISDPSGSASCIHLFCIWNKAPPCSSSPHLSSFSQSPFPSKTLQLSKSDQALRQTSIPSFHCKVLHPLSAHTLSHMWKLPSCLNDSIWKFCSPHWPSLLRYCDPQRLCYFLDLNPNI